MRVSIAQIEKGIHEGHSAAAPQGKSKKAKGKNGAKVIYELSHPLHCLPFAFLLFTFAFPPQVGVSFVDVASAVTFGHTLAP